MKKLILCAIAVIAFAAFGQAPFAPCEEAPYADTADTANADYTSQPEYPEDAGYAGAEENSPSQRGTPDTYSTRPDNPPAEDAEETPSRAPTAGAAAPQAGEPIHAGTVGKAELLSPLLSESFRTDLATGAATVTIPIVVPPGRKNMQPKLALSYSSNNPNGVCGVGWALSLSSIQRSTKKGPPKYDNTDTFIFSSSGATGELIATSAGEYRQKIESAFMRYLYNGSNWIVYDKNGTKYTFGTSVNSQIEDSSRVFAWYLDRVEDVYGNAVDFTYIKDSSQIYLSRVMYTSNDSQGLGADKTVDFVYTARTFAKGAPDIIYNYRSGWKIETRKRLAEIRISVDGALKWKYLLTYARSGDTGRSLLSEVKLEDAGGNSLPPKRFTYQTVE